MAIEAIHHRSLRGEAPSKKQSPSPSKERGIKGVRLINNRCG
jgi:hypothetical protein